MNTPTKTTITVEHHARELMNASTNVLLSENKNSLWFKNEFGSMVRMPDHCLTAPTHEDTNRLFWSKKVAIMGYHLAESDQSPANTLLYICRDQDYELSNLTSAMRRNVRRGLKELKISFFDRDELLNHGMAAFCDTRARNGLSDGTPTNFSKRYTQWSKCKGHRFLGAWKDDQLVGFLSIVDVANWAEIEGCFSMTSFLKLRPNDTLLFSALKYYLTEENYELVSYGLSSLQTESNVAGLHAFKTKVGFDAVRIHRQFEVHPILRPFINGMTKAGIKTALKFNPRNRLLKKVDGVIKLMNYSNKKCNV